jgi:8-oxo-dGTP diphosphatase
MSNNGRLRVIPSVFTIVLEDDKVLLLRRANTKWLDGWYDLPAGHLEDQEGLKEGAARELNEETGLVTKPTDLKLVHLYQNHHYPDAPHYGFIFLAKKWSGQTSIMEPAKCDDMQFFPLDQLPEQIAPYAKAAIANIDGNDVTISYHAPDSIK